MLDAAPANFFDQPLAQDGVHTPATPGLFHGPIRDEAEIRLDQIGADGYRDNSPLHKTADHGRDDQRVGRRRQALPK